jgi:hypothetical protein
MEENKILLINQIDLNKIIYSKVNEMNDKKLVHIYYEKVGQKLLFQTPQLLNIFELQKSQYFNELILPLYDCNLKVPILINFLKNLDSKVVDDARKNKNEWFKNKPSIKYKSLIKNLYLENNNSSDEKKYASNGLIKIKITNGIKIIENGNEINLDALKKNNFLRMILELHAVWISGDVFGIYLKPIMIEQIQNKIINFIDDKEDATEVNYLETEANSEDKYIDEQNIVPYTLGKVEKSLLKSESSESNTNSKIDNVAKMYHFGLHDINDDLFNKLKKDKKITSLLSELNSNNTRKDITLSEMSSEIEDMTQQIKEDEEEEENEEEDEEDEEDDDSETSNESEFQNHLRR